MTPTPRPHFARAGLRLLVVLWGCAALLLAPLGSTGLAVAEVDEVSTAATKTPPVPSGLPSDIEGLAAYVPASSCSPTTRPGTALLGRLLTSTYSGTSFGGARECGALPNSEHHDGRAVDWMNSVRNDKQAAQAKAVISWLFAADSQGRPYANARRLGVMYVIWNNKIWGAYSADEGWREYNDCSDHKAKNYDTSCHRDHMHLSLSWAGATGQTSFWSDEVAAADYGRCRPADLNWSYSYEAPNPTPCKRHAVIKAKSGASSLSQKLTQYSGRYLKKGYTGAAVKVIQQAVKATTTSTYDAKTVTAVKKWQGEHAVTETGTINHDTWRALLKANAPK